MGCQRSFLQSHHTHASCPNCSTRKGRPRISGLSLRKFSTRSHLPLQAQPHDEIIFIGAVGLFGDCRDNLLPYTQTPETTPPSLYTNHAPRQSRPFGLTRRSTLFASARSIRPVRKLRLRVPLSTIALGLPDLRLSVKATSSFLLHTTSHNHVCRSSETTGACSICTSTTSSAAPSSRGPTRLICTEGGWRQ